MTLISRLRQYIEKARGRREFRELQQLWQHGERVLGERGWFLFKCYGKMMSGPHSGRYVSALPPSDVHALLDALAAQQRIPVHLMHRHRPGDHPGSYTRLGTDGRLIMGFDDCEVDA